MTKLIFANNYSIMVIHAHPRILFIHNKQQNDLIQMVLQLDVFHAMK